MFDLDQKHEMSLFCYWLLEEFSVANHGFLCVHLSVMF